MKQQTSNPDRQKISRSSQLLTQEENEQIFCLLGRKCQSMCTSVAQLYKTEASAHSHWKKKHTGVVCFVKDSSKRSYFLRMYCLVKNDLVWEHELYDSIRISKPRSYLLTFEGQDGHVALNFASEEECDSYYRVADITAENRNRKRQERKHRPKSQIAPAAPLIQQNDIEDTSKVVLRNHPKISSIQLTPNPNTSQLKSSTLLAPKQKKRGQRRYTKADISTPMNFVHISHVGWDAQKGFDLTGNDDDEMLKHFFNKAGVSEQQLNDRDTRAFIYDFIQSNNVLASVKSEQVEKPKAPSPPAPPVPPPVPSRQQAQNGTQRTAPPPPPSRQPPPPLPPTTPPTRGPPPSRPPPIVVSNTPAPVTPPAPPPPPPLPQPQTSVAPPPPPPMPVAFKAPEPSISEKKPTVASLPVVNDTRSALMDSIRKGTTLRKVDTAALSTSSGDSRSDLMSEIRQGIELRPASSRELPASGNRCSDDGAGTDALADALRRALQERGRVIHSSDDDSDESSDNDGEWED